MLLSDDQLANIYLVHAWRPAGALPGLTVH